MSTRFFIPLLLAGLLGAGQSAARVSDVTDPGLPRQLPEAGPVDVQWDDPGKFTDITHSRNRWEARRGDWVRQIAQYIRSRAEKRLAPGERLEVTLHDIRRAGDYEPWHGPRDDSIRYVRDIYPPRMTLSFQLTGSDGRVIAQGERKLTDLAFMTNTALPGNTDALRYEKRLVDDWLRKEFKSAAI
ncbi:DUF3016 domain-containing protein [Luteimonas aquatica]|uniref:DUF3016 domain-containing protein n=1 Tax=Luteimonas aquatica TaxID=450364 RepID=UPI001F55EAEF|nr:DUF3016 domain-containing protein [Luteimonas aquatica]